MRTFSTILLATFLSASALSAQEASPLFKYEIDLTYYADDLFHVTGYPDPLVPGDSIYSFVAFGPGVHQVLDTGRFVKSFKVFDREGNEIETTRRGTNDWRIARPTDVHKIQYDIEDSFDADIDEHIVYPMSGAGIEDKYVVINNTGVLGYFVDHRSIPVKLTIHHNPEWQVGTALKKADDGSYYADSYYHLADSPFLLGELTVATMKVGDIDVEMYVHSPIEELNADLILGLAEDVLTAAYDFVGFAPVDRYAFLMYFHDSEATARNVAFRGGGALEHSYSSTYALEARPEFLDMLVNIMAHEFMHILTPLNLRSEHIAYFDYSKPTSEDQHVWLYEGVTEWVSNIMQLRAGMIDVDEYVNRMSGKIGTSEQYGRDYSLTRISAEWHTDEGNRKYGNIYQLGALTANALDLTLLRLSDGERGLREVYIDLIQKYGKDQPFDNDTFFEEFVEMTYPEIGTFVTNFITGNQPLDYDYDYSLLGIDYIESRPSSNLTPVMGLQFTSPDGQHLSLSGFGSMHVDYGLEVGDIVMKIFGQDLTISNYGQVFAETENMRPGDTFEISVLRGETEHTFQGTLFERVDTHVFEVSEHATDEQEAMRARWSRNLEMDQ